MKETTNYKFKKPNGTDAVNIEEFNSNIDIIDNELKRLNDTKQNSIKTNMITLTATSWVNNSQTININNITPNSLLWVTPGATSLKDYTTSMIRATSQDNGSLTFMCDEVPSNDLSVIVVNGGDV